MRAGTPVVQVHLDLAADAVVDDVVLLGGRVGLLVDHPPGRQRDPTRHGFNDLGIGDIDITNTITGRRGRLR